MKHLLLLTMLFCCGFVFFVSCEKDKFNVHDDFTKSKLVWEAFKQSSNNSYTYTINESTWIGDAWVTRIDVRNGKIVKRSFHYTRIGNVSMPKSGWTHTLVKQAFLEQGYIVSGLESYPHADLAAVAQWVEEGQELGVNGNSRAAVLWTLDEVYSFAKISWLREGTDGKRIFEANNNGMISSVGFIVNNCMDDCFNGVHICCIAVL